MIDDILHSWPLKKIKYYISVTTRDTSKSVQNTNPMKYKSEIRYQWRIQDFPEEGAPTPRGGGAPTYDFAKISQKLHEIERIWTTGGGRPKFYYVDPPLDITH